MSNLRALNLLKPQHPLKTSFSPILYTCATGPIKSTYQKPFPSNVPKAFQGQSPTAKISPVEVSQENTHSHKMAHISFSRKDESHL